MDAEADLLTGYSVFDDNFLTVHRNMSLVGESHLLNDTFVYFTFFHIILYGFPQIHPLQRLLPAEKSCPFLSFHAIVNTTPHLAK
jgi:hypothetical protein